MTRALNHENGGLANIATFVIGQVGMVTLALAWVWVAGLRFLWRSGEPLWRGMACAYGLLFVLFTLTAGAKTYYLAAAYVYLLAAGAVAIDGWLQARPGRLRNLMLATALTTAAVLPAVLPVLPPADTGWTYKTSPTLDETIGWPQLARTGYTAYLSQFFTSVRVAATLSNPYRIHNRDWGGHVYVCTGPASHGPSYGHGCATTT